MPSRTHLPEALAAFTAFVTLATITFGTSPAWSSAPRHDIVCQIKNESLDLTVTLKDGAPGAEGPTAEVVSRDEQGQIDFTHSYATSGFYDGHMTTLLTARGFSMSFENWFGCIHNARITTDVRGGDLPLVGSMTVDQCRGGTTSDSTCGR
jgi:hypothetical protein